MCFTILNICFTYLDRCSFLVLIIAQILAKNTKSVDMFCIKIFVHISCKKIFIDTFTLRIQLSANCYLKIPAFAFIVACYRELNMC